MQTIWPQPMLTDLEFDASGAMVLGLADRLGFQGGNKNYSPVSGDTTLYDVAVGGDVLRACLVNGAYVLESGAACGGVQTDPSFPGSVAECEFRTGRWRILLGENYGFNTHNETALGGLLQFPGASEVATSAFSPMFAARSQGMLWLSHSSGKKTRAYQVAGADYPSATASMGKASGLGDLELLCDPAPVQIGNRVWRDVDGNGIQDPAEPPLANVQVRLTLANGTTTFATTDSNGHYLFSSAPLTDTAASKHNLPLLAGTVFTLSIDAAQPALIGLAPTLGNAEAVTSNDAIDDVRDSDSSGVSGSVAGAGRNNHSYDFGFSATTPTPTATTPANTATPTAIPPTATTPANTATPTAIPPTATTPANTATPTAIPPTATTPANTATPTAIPPTATTPANTATPTAIPPTATTPANTATPTAIRRPRQRPPTPRHRRRSDRLRHQPRGHRSPV